MNLHRTPRTRLITSLPPILAVALLFSLTPRCYSDVLVGPIVFLEGSSVTTDSPQPSNVLSKSNTGTATLVTNGYQISGQDIMTIKMTRPQVQPINITWGYHRIGFAPVNANGSLTVSGSGLSIVETGGTFGWGITITGFVENSNDSSSNDMVVPGGMVTASVSGHGSSKTGSIAWTATTPSFQVLANQNYDVEMTMSINLVPVIPQGATLEFDPGSFGISNGPAITPEPSSFVLMGLGGLLLPACAAWRRRRSRGPNAR